MINIVKPIGIYSITSSSMADAYAEEVSDAAEKVTRVTDQETDMRDCESGKRRTFRKDNCRCHAAHSGDQGAIEEN
jgi:hypothetical protein